MKTKPILLIASFGGHWTELVRLNAFYEKHQTVFVTTEPTARKHYPGVKIVRDANRNEKLNMLICMIQLLVLTLKNRPSMVVSTGATPGVLGILVGRLLGCKTVWIDSIANAEELSMSGQLAGKIAHKWLTQWPDIASDTGPEYRGRVL